MVTSADGAEKFYNESHTGKSITKAREEDKKLRNAYLGHYNFFMIDNNVPDFHAKKSHLVNIVSKIVGLPTRKTFYRKYLMECS